MTSDREKVGRLFVFLFNITFISEIVLKEFGFIIYYGLYYYYVSRVFSNINLI